eukprot:TRINITY_DN34_c0_g1_i2.p1 TRINITY_DN34_c0_g1~~TRINITY_DN34_c0_g1_i2.p1  ORF type:complete len:153 (+),score=44.72 TRINITY_DN34_c0_g1_i2:190-648(+)
MADLAKSELRSEGSAQSQKHDDASKSIPFKDAFSFNERLAESTKMRNRYDDRVPVIAEPMDHTAPTISQKKFLFPTHFTIGQCIAVIRRRIAIKPEQVRALPAGAERGTQATFIFADGVAPSTSSTLEQVDAKFRDEDGFLYLNYGAENAFG